MVQHVLTNIRPNVSEVCIDKAWWRGNTNGTFTVKSAFHMVRCKKAEEEWRKFMWVKGLPIKISFFLWRVWRRIIATDDNLKRRRMQVVSKYYCCETGEMETMSHLLLTAPVAQKLWKQFASCACVIISELTLQQLIFKWSEHSASSKLEHILKAIPAIIMWELWKRRNARRYGKEVTYNRIKGNPGKSAYGYCIRDGNGDLINAEAHNIGEATNMEAEDVGEYRGREANQLANFMANTTINSEQKLTFQQFNQLPSKATTIEVTGFLSYAMYNLDFWSKRVVQEHFLSYVSQQKVIHGPTKGESLGALSEFKMSSQRRAPGEEARELLGSLIFGFNWKTTGIRCLQKKRKKKTKEIQNDLQRSTKLNARLTPSWELDKNSYRLNEEHQGNMAADRDAEMEN
ncbi:hypothetical protein KY284_036033 [Solanum tuberosum]|nr:hypothetical protein KY284_036033 [Solanum tuberosum]